MRELPCWKKSRQRYSCIFTLTFTARSAGVPQITSLYVLFAVLNDFLQYETLCEFPHQLVIAKLVIVALIL